MAQDDEKGLSLPPPPPPSPARRKAAIDMALRRFDAAESPSKAPEQPPVIQRASWWTKINRPQMGILVSAALVAVIGVPTVLKMIDRQPELHRGHQPAPVADIEIAAKPSQPALKEVAPERAGTPQMQRAPAASPAPVTASEDVDAVADRSTADLAAPAAPAPAPPPPPPPSAIVASADPSARAAKAAENRGFAQEAMSDVVVTASRREQKPASRGDWNACTVNDPTQNLAQCGRSLRRDAKGGAKQDAKARAATHVADGLALAWRGDDNEAIAAFDQAIALSPKLSAAYLNRGLIYQRVGDLGRAIADLDRAVRYAPDAARAHYSRSLLLRQRGGKGDAEKAIADEERALALDSRYRAVVK